MRWASAAGPSGTAGGSRTSSTPHLAGLLVKRHPPVEDLRVASCLELCVVLALFDLLQGLFDFGLQLFPGIGALDLYDCGTLVPLILHDKIEKALSTFPVGCHWIQEHEKAKQQGVIEVLPVLVVLDTGTCEEHRSKRLFQILPISLPEQLDKVLQLVLGQHLAEPGINFALENILHFPVWNGKNCSPGARGYDAVCAV